ncbi:MAG TPA: TIGR03560 family F420-dependent LLM class oxidoreductase [Acidimicrobiia bacterium]|nr:TIGR03560 family F420-dependent LLM class oxidoreductase [Acidimicrobiia bacterium]
MGRYGIKTPNHHTTWDNMLEVWREADGIELFESAWNWDHLYPLRSDPHGTSLDGWVTLSALARETSRIRIGSMVNGMHFRLPSITAKMAVTLDHISGGRSYLGLGAGWFEEEAEAHGIELGSLRERFDRFDEGLEVIVSLMTKEATSYSGEFYELKDALSEPKATQKPHPPIVIGGTGEKRTLAAVARWAQMWDALLVDTGEWSRLREVLEDHCRRVGRDSSDIDCSVHVRYSHDEEAEAVAEQAARHLDNGVDVVIFTMGSPNDPSMVTALATALDAVG